MVRDEELRPEANFGWVIFTDGVFAQILKHRNENTPEGVIAKMLLRPSQQLKIKYNITDQGTDGYGSSIREYKESSIVLLNPDPSGQIWLCWEGWDGQKTIFAKTYAQKFLDRISSLEKENDNLRAYNATLQEDNRELMAQKLIYFRKIAEMQKSIKSERREIPIEEELRKLPEE